MFFIAKHVFLRKSVGFGLAEIVFFVNFIISHMTQYLQRYKVAKPFFFTSDQFVRLIESQWVIIRFSLNFD